MIIAQVDSNLLTQPFDQVLISDQLTNLYNPKPMRPIDMPVIATPLPLTPRLEPLLRMAAFCFSKLLWPETKVNAPRPMNAAEPAECSKLAKST